MGKKIRNQNLEVATLAGGCFWCFEPLFGKLKGVFEVKVGYAGGNKANPSYEQVSGGNTGSVEAFQFKFDPKIIGFDKLLDIFFYMHDPTTFDQQGNDVGTQYRSIIFFHNSQQEKLAKEKIANLTKDKAFEDPIVTEVYPFKNFYKAEEYHQKYFENNPNQPYCSLIIRPKIEKFEEKFKPLLR